MLLTRALTVSTCTLDKLVRWPSSWVRSAMVSRSRLEEQPHQLGSHNVLWQRAELHNVLVQVDATLRGDQVVNHVEGSRHERENTFAGMSVCVRLATCLGWEMIQKRDLELVKVLIETVKDQITFLAIRRGRCVGRCGCRRPGNVSGLDAEPVIALFVVERVDGS